MMRSKTNEEAQRRHLYPPWTVEDHSRLMGAWIDLFWPPTVMFRLVILSAFSLNMRAI